MTMTTTRATTMQVARERQLDWLLTEVLAGVVPAAVGPTTFAGRLRQWLVAALIVLGGAVVFGVAMLQNRGGDTGGGTVLVPPVPQDEPAVIPWLECHGEAALGGVPADAVALRCFDFTNDGVARLTGLERLRWLSLQDNHAVTGSTLGVLRALPHLEHLDLTATGVDSDGIAQLPQLASLHELVLSRCAGFHGRSLADIAKVKGLRRLELAGCTTVAAADVARLAALRDLVHLDLGDCVGAFRGQTAHAGDPDATGLDRPQMDGIGVTDAAVAALVGLPLTTLRLDGCEALTDGIAESLAKLPTLRRVGLGGLPRITANTLAALPEGLVELSLDGSLDLRGGLAPTVARFAQLEVLGMNGLAALNDAALFDATARKPLRVLRLGGRRRMMDAVGPEGAFRPQLTAATVARVLALLPTLEVLDASYSDWFDADVAAAVAKLQRLHTLDLQAARLPRRAFEALGASRSLRDLRLPWVRGVDVAAMDALGRVPLRELDLRGCSDLKLKDLGLFESWPGVRARLPDGSLHCEPALPGGRSGR